jgi:TIR domain
MVVTQNGTLTPGSVSHERMAMELGKPDDTAESRAAKPREAFLSHSSEDNELAQQLCTSLESRGVACWIAPRDLAPGHSYALGCLQGVAESRTFVLLASEKALASVQVLSEVEQAHKRAKPILTVLIPPAKVRGEMDFYLSRLHWMQSSGRTTEEIAATLAAVLARKRPWEEVASPPTIRRTMQYRPVAFAKLVMAAVVGLAIVLGVVAWALNHALNVDFRRLGYVNLAVEPEDSGRAMGHAQIWVMAQGVHFQDVRLAVAMESADGGLQERQYSTWAAPEQVGSMEEIVIPLDAGVQRLTTCLVVPSPGLHAPYRVTQRFVLMPEKSGVRVAETSEKLVSKEDGSPCGGRPSV